MSTLIVKGKVSREPTIRDNITVIPVSEAYQDKDKNWQYNNFDLLVFPKQKTNFATAKTCQKGDTVMAQCNMNTESIKVETEEGNRYYNKNSCFVNTLVCGTTTTKTTTNTSTDDGGDDIPY